MKSRKLAATDPSTIRGQEHVANGEFGRAIGQCRAARALPVELQGEVTYSDPEWGLLFVRDPTGSIFINVHGITKWYPSGTRVLIDGETGPGDVGPAYREAENSDYRPRYTPRSGSEKRCRTDAGEADSSLVATEGVLHPCQEEWTRICYRLFDGRKQAWVIVPLPVSPATQALIGARVRVTGVAGLHLDAQNKPLGAQVFVNSMDDIKVEQAALNDPFSTAPTSIGSLSPAETDQRFARLVHIRGTVTWESPQRFIVQDSTGGMTVQTAQARPVHSGNFVDLVGFLGRGESTPLLLSDSMMRLSAAQSKQDAIVTARSDRTGDTQALIGREASTGARPAAEPDRNGNGICLCAGGRRLALYSDTAPQRSHAGIVGLARNSLLELTGVRSSRAERRNGRIPDDSD